MEMNITSARYKTKLAPDNSEIDRNIIAVINGTEMTVPLDPANRHYAPILEWAEEDGNTIQDAD